MNRKKIFQISFASVVVLLAAVGTMNMLRGYSAPAVSEGFIAASGRVEGDEVNVSAKLTGRVDRLLVSEGQEVKRGQLLAEIGAAEIEARLAQANASGLAARKQAAQAEQSLGATREMLAQSEAQLVRAESDWRCYRSLLKEEVVSRNFFTRVEADYRGSRAARDAAALRVREAVAAVSAAKAVADAAKEQAREIEALFAEAKITSPISGVVTTKVAQQGEVVQAGSPIAVLVDLSDLHLKVYLPEARVGRVRLGDEARIYTDAFPGRYFAARVAEISKQAEFTPKNVETREERVKLVFGVKLRAANPAGLLKPGLPADALIRVAKKKAPWPEKTTP
jgi:HlyD family secretion protein